jgi:hypothetical protein
MTSQVESPMVSNLHAEGRHIAAEWERLKINSADNEATKEDLDSHRLSFFLGAVALWQAMQEAEVDESVVDDLQAELEVFLETMEANGHIALSERPGGQPLQ